MKFNKIYGVVIIGLWFFFITNMIVAKNEFSVYKETPNDPEAVYLTQENFDVHGDGYGDDAPALQAAIDAVLKKRGQGIVFIPEGTYRLGNTVRLWKGIRLIGYGAQRPIFKLRDDSPGFQDGDHKYMIHFCSRPDINKIPQTGVSWEVAKSYDGNWGTFYSGIDNINFEIGKGNPAAIAIRFHIAQLCFLRHIDFNIGDGRGAVEDMGNIIENCTFRGGDYGIKTKASPPHWQCMVLDCSFEGQRSSGIITDDARMLVMHSKFSRSPVGIQIPGTDKLYVKNTWFQDITNCAINVNNFVPPELQVNLTNIRLSNVPFSIRFRGRAQGWSSNELKMDYEAPSAFYQINSFSHGLHIDVTDGVKNNAKFTTKIDQNPLKKMGTHTSSDIPSLNAQKDWVNIQDLGAVGDGKKDITKILRKAIDKYEAIYFPIGKYLVSGTITLKEKTQLIGFHPNETQFVLKDKTPGYSDLNHPKPVIVAQKGGTNIVSGIGFKFGDNPGLIGIKWMAGSHSMITDGVFNGFYGANKNREAQKHSIWVTNDGGGIFKNLWICDVRAQLAFFISNTNTPGNIYEISVEHHQQNFEVELKNAQNWSFYGLQFEEDKWADNTSCLYMQNCSNILLANLISHRTTGVWKPCFTGIEIRNTKGLSIQGVEVRGGVFPFENSLYDETSGVTIPYRYFTRLDIK